MRQGLDRVLSQQAAREEHQRNNGTPVRHYGGVQDSAVGSAGREMFLKAFANAPFIRKYADEDRTEDEPMDKKKCTESVLVYEKKQQTGEFKALSKFIIYKYCYDACMCALLASLYI